MIALMALAMAFGAEIKHGDNRWICLGIGVIFALVWIGEQLSDIKRDMRRERERSGLVTAASAEALLRSSGFTVTPEQQALLARLYGGRR